MKAEPDAHDAPPVALLTGFPRLVAAELARRGLEDAPQGRVRLLVEKAHAPQAEAFRDALSPTSRARLEILIGRPDALDLGLSGEQVRSVIADTTHVLHADQVSAGPGESLLRRNIERLHAVSALAGEIPGLQRLVVFSSVFVSGDRNGIIYEEDLDAGQRHRTPFERSMFVCERYLRTIMPHVPITILRPAAMIGHSRTGDSSGLTDGPNYLVHLMVRLPAEVPFLLPGTGRVPFNIVPVDFVVQAAWALAMDPAAAGRTFHLTDSNPVSTRQAFALLSELANRPAPFTGQWPTRMLKQVLQISGVGRLAPKQVALFQDLTRDVTYHCGGALELLARAGVTCPPFETYADTLVAWVAQYERELREGAVLSA